MIDYLEYYSNGLFYDAAAALEYLKNVPELYAEGISGLEVDYKRYQKARELLNGRDIIDCFIVKIFRL